MGIDGDSMVHQSKTRGAVALRFFPENWRRSDQLTDQKMILKEETHFCGKKSCRWTP